MFASSASNSPREDGRESNAVNSQRTQVVTEILGSDLSPASSAARNGKRKTVQQ